MKRINRVNKWTYTAHLLNQDKSEDTVKSCGKKQECFKCDGHLESRQLGKTPHSTKTGVKCRRLPNKLKLLIISTAVSSWTGSQMIDTADSNGIAQNANARWAQPMTGFLV